MAGVVAGRYRLLRPLGSGGMGEVFLVEDPWRAGRQLALKLARSSEAAEALEREFALLSRVRHPHVVGAEDMGFCAERGVWYLALPLAEGGPLSDMIAAELPEERALLLAALARTLDHVHSRNIIHGDIKAANVLAGLRRADGGRALKLIDFGLGSGPEGGVATGGFSGTLTHAAPERLLGGPPSRAADLFALGVTAHELLAGRLPDPSPESAAPVPSRSGASAASLAASAPWLPPAVLRAVDELLMADPASRPPSAFHLSLALGHGETEAEWTAWSRAPDLVRSEEAGLVLDAFARRWEDARGAGPRAVLLLGAAGMGKTRALAEMVRAATIARVRVLRGRAGATRDPFELFAEPVREAVQALGPDSGSVREWLPELVKVVPDLAEFAGAVPSLPLPASDERLRIARAVVEMLAAFSVRPCLVVLDDVHQADPEAAWLLDYLVRHLRILEERGKPLALSLLAAGRSTEASTGVQACFRREGSTVELHAYDASQVETHLRTALPGLEGAGEAADVLHVRSGGSPALVERWLRDLLACGAMKRQLAGWKADLAHPAFAALPADLSEARAAEVEKLPADERSALRLLTLLPGGEQISSIAVLLGWTRDRCTRVIDHLQSEDLVSAPARPLGRRAQLSSTLVRDVTLSRWTEGERRAFAADALARADEGRALAPASRAELSQASGDRVRAALEWSLVLQALMSQHDHARIALAAERLANVAEPPGRRSALRVRARALLELDRREEALTCLADAAVPDDGTSEERLAHADIETDVLVARGESEKALHVMNAAEPFLVASDPRRFGWELRRLRLASVLGAPDAEACHARAVSLATSDSERRDLSLALAAHLLRVGRTEEARRMLLEISGQDEDVVGTRALAAVANNLGVAALRLESFDEAARWFTKSAALRSSSGARGAAAGPLLNLGLLEIRRGRPGVATRHLRAARDVKEEVGDLLGVLQCDANLAVALLDLEDVTRALRVVSQGEALLEAAPDSLSRAVFMAARALALSSCGRSESVEAARDVFLRAQAMNSPSRVATALAGWADAVDRSGADASAVRHALANFLAGEPGGLADLETGELLVAYSRLLSHGASAFTAPAPLPNEVDAAEALRLAESAQGLLGSAASPGAVVRVRLARAAALACAANDESAVKNVEAELESILPLLARVPGRSSRIEWLAARAWVARERSQHAEAADLLEEALRHIKRSLTTIPKDWRASFLATPHRRALRASFLAARAAAMESQARRGYFDVLPERPVQAAAASGNEGTARAAAEEVKRLRQVIDITRDINALVPVQELLDRILESAMRFLDAERAFIVLGTSEDLVFAASRDRRGQRVPQAGFHVSRTVLAEVVRTKKSVLLSDARLDERFGKQLSVVHLDLRSVLVAPLVAREQVIGALHLDNPAAEGVFDESDRDLLTLFAAQAAVAVENARLHRLGLDKERMEQELELARSIQQGLLPGRLPETTEFVLAASMEPAREIGGDWYDVIDLPGGGFRIALGDVSGKGVPAGLLMIMARTILRSVGSHEGRLDAVMSQANDVLEPQIEDDRFMTCLLLEPDAGGTTVRLCLAGHEPPLVFRRGTGEVDALESGGIALGMLPRIGPMLREELLSLSTGDLLVCYTDGVTECRSEVGTLFGKARLVESLKRHGSSGAGATLAALRADVDAFRGEAERSDDVTLLVLERR